MRAVISAESRQGMIPSLSVVHTPPSRPRNEAPALSSPAKPSRPPSRPSTNHLKPTGTSYSRRPKPRGNAIDHAAAHYGFADGDILAPVLPVRKQVVDADRKVVVRGQQAAPLGDDAVAVVVGIGGKRNVEFVFQSDEPLHGVRRGGIHANFAVPIHGHESKGGIDGFVHDRQIETVALGDQRPIINARATERVDAQR